MSPRRSLNLTMGPRPLRLVDGNIPLSPTLVTKNPSPPPSCPLSKPNVRRHSSISYRLSDDIKLPPLSTSPEHSSTSPASSHGGQPLTLVEKHSDLLHFIAQKESKCLELRSQLTNLEAEIVQLKRKWERIVNRGFLNNPPASVSTAQGNGAVFEGIVGGMQGVGRFIAAGLAIGEQKPPSPPLPRPLSATCTTKSSSLSQSPTSSIAASSNAGDGESAQILMVHDTGATPTMSPNPAFERQRQQQQQQGQCILQADFEVPLLGNPKLRRRKLRDGHEGSSTSFQSTSEATGAANEAMRAKRATVHGTSFPPVSSIPGLAALTVGPVSPVPPLVESVGKKWEELQRSSTFSKNQKRASVLLSDVSQSIKSVLSSSSTSVTTQSSPPPSYFSPSSAESNCSFKRSAVTSFSNNNNSDYAFVSQRMTFGPNASIPGPKTESTSPTLIDLVDEKTRPAAKSEDAWNW